MARTPSSSRTSPPSRSPRAAAAAAPTSDVDNWADIAQRKELETEHVRATDQSESPIVCPNSSSRNWDRRGRVGKRALCLKVVLISHTRTPPFLFCVCSAPPVLVDDIMDGLRKLADKLGEDAWMWEDDGKGPRVNQKDVM